jgi:hypothetical protein
VLWLSYPPQVYERRDLIHAMRDHARTMQPVYNNMGRLMGDDPAARDMARCLRVVGVAVGEAPVAHEGVGGAGVNY